MKCISIDLDGTLLNPKQELTEESTKTLKELQKKGYEVILNTGRAYGDVIKLEAIKNLGVPIFCINGSVLYSNTGDLMYEATIPVSEYKEIFSSLKQLGVGILVYTNHGGFPSTLPPLHNKSEEELDLLFEQCDYEAILKLDDLKIYKLIALVYNGQLEKVKEVKETLDGRFNISMASSYPNNVEITSGEAHKGKALLRYQQLKNESFEEIISLGDGGNDLQMFSVSTVSVAMGNAPIEIKEKATLVTKTNDEDGFSYAIRDLLKLI